MSFPPHHLPIRWTFHGKVLRYLFSWEGVEPLPVRAYIGITVVGVVHGMFRRFFFYK